MANLGETEDQVSINLRQTLIETNSQSSNNFIQEALSTLEIINIS